MAIDLSRLARHPDWIRISNDIRTFFRRQFADVPDEITAHMQLLKDARIPLAVPGAVSEPEPVPSGRLPEGYHTDDYQLVVWGGQRHVLGGEYQRAAVRVLLEAHEAGTPELAERTILQRIGAQSAKLRDLFRGSAAWGTLVVQVAGTTLYRLAVRPEDEPGAGEG